MKSTTRYGKKKIEIELEPERVTSRFFSQREEISSSIEKKAKLEAPKMKERAKSTGVINSIRQTRQRTRLESGAPNTKTATHQTAVAAYQKKILQPEKKKKKVLQKEAKEKKPTSSISRKKKAASSESEPPSSESDSVSESLSSSYSFSESESSSDDDHFGKASPPPKTMHSRRNSTGSLTKSQEKSGVLGQEMDSPIQGSIFTPKIAKTQRTELPTDFEYVYKKILEMRQKAQAPIDTMGCERIADQVDDKQDESIGENIPENALNSNANCNNTSNEQNNNYEEKNINLKEEEKGKLQESNLRSSTGLNEQINQKASRFQTLVGLMLSSQTKDEITFGAVKNLKNHLAEQGKVLSVPNLLNMTNSQIDDCIKKVGFHTKKAVYLQRTAQILHDKYNDDIPDSVAELIKLPGVGPKMAHLAMQAGWNKTVGIAVDTHVFRITKRLGWSFLGNYDVFGGKLQGGKNKANASSNSKLVEETRKELQGWIPQEKWNEVNHMLVGFGQTICRPVNPLCSSCELSQGGHCPWFDTYVRSRLQRKNSSSSLGVKE